MKEEARKEKDQADKVASECAQSLARRCLAWLIWTDLLPATLRDAEAEFALAGVSLQELPADGGHASDVGPTRLRRIGAVEEWLPPDDRNFSPSSAGAVDRGESPLVAALVPPAAMHSTGSESKASGGRPGDDETPITIEPAGILAISVSTLPYAVRAQATELPLNAAAAPVPETPIVASVAAPTENPDPSAGGAPATGLWRIALSPPDADLLERVVRGAGQRPAESPSRADIVVGVDRHGEQVNWHVGERRETSKENEWGEGELLIRALVEQRCERLLEELGDSGLVGVSVSTYGDDLLPSANVSFAPGTTEPDRLPDLASWSELLMARWRQRIEKPVGRIAQALGRAPRTRWIKLYPMCTLGAAIRCGVWFHSRSRFSVVCDQNGQEWDLDHQPVRSAKTGSLRMTEIESALGAHDSEGSSTKRGTEVHLLLSLTAPVFDRYHQWRTSATGVQPQLVLHVEPESGPSRTAVVRE